MTSPPTTYSMDPVPVTCVDLDGGATLVNPTRDVLYGFDEAEHQRVCQQQPWTKSAQYFTHVRIAAAALAKMTMHAREGGAIEVMGLMQGYVRGTSIVVTDAFRLPVEGTETRVNAQDEANEYLVEYLASCRAQGRAENPVGWYHSHPGYGCWLSGIDVATQQLQQKFSDPFCAVVIDPEKTVGAGKVEIGSFRTLPEGAMSSMVPKAGISSSINVDAVRADKMQDFGAHHDKYYALQTVIYKSTVDAQLLELLWNKYWTQTLLQNPLLANRESLANSIQEAQRDVSHVSADLAVGDTNGLQNNKFSSSIIEGVSHSSRKLLDLASTGSAGLAAMDVRRSLFSEFKVNAARPLADMATETVGKGQK